MAVGVRYPHVFEMNTAIWSRVTWVEGQKVFDRSDPKDRLYATGGYGASHDQSPFLHLDGDDEEGQ